MRLVAVLSVLLVVLAAPTFADDAFIGSQDNPIELGSWVDQGFNHEDGSPFKGTAYVFVKNTSLNPWGDFHFKIFSYDGSDVSNVDFKDASMGGMDPISTQVGTTWAIDNSVVGAEMSLYFYGDPVLPGEFAAFQVYTDNTVGMGNFGVCIWPSPVPEPSSLLALVSLLPVAGFALRRRR